eukprot:TRINITY_DN64540_c0_g1_i1.p1 TRINITY_DN64540_c0_g1~~TRINITY_DN64540_c0_g1_i1.p1  ORF type:complete len:308 (-),score=83.79 TRINITY_DN64540_c0_g1_i1:151-1074(-)
MAPAPCLADFMEAVARKQKAEPPMRYGYKLEVDLGIGFFREEQTGCHVVEKPVIIPSGRKEYLGYVVFFAYCGKEGMMQLLEGACPPVLPASKKEPANFASLEAIADNFGAKDAKAASANATYCVPLRVPVELANQAEVPGRDIWMVQFNLDKISPFLQAAKEGDAAKVQSIIADPQGVKGPIVDEDGVSALMMAAFAGSAETCQALLGGGAEINYAEPDQNRTALMFAAQGGYSPVVQVLLNAKADASKVDNDGQTALHWAAVANKAETAKLLSVHCPKDAKNREGLTALDVAEKMKHANTVAALK